MFLHLESYKKKLNLPHIMGIREDAGEILGFVYNKYISENFGGVNSENLISETDWDKDRVKRTVDYLDQKDLIKVIKYLGGNFWIQTIKPEGVDIVEHQDEFKNTFGIGLNLGLISFSWNREKK